MSPVQPLGISKDRYWLHALLLILTLWTTTGVGARLAYNFQNNRPAYLVDDVFGMLPMLASPAALAQGLPFSLTLLAILFAHEMGHYLTCRYYGIDASLPYFLPAPSLIGTLGAFIRIRSAIFTKRQLFDIGVAGPIAGFVFIVPALAIGLAYSRIAPGIIAQGDFDYSAPLLQKALAMAIFPGVSAGDIHLHPVGRAAWAGLLATALNLMPIGQLDGGHILYAFVGERHRLLTRIFIAALIPLGFFYSYSWLLWAALLLLFGMRHPRIYDSDPLTGGRVKLGVLSLIIFVLSFSVTPISPGS